MAVDVCSEVSSLVVSPRISFSHDLRDSDPAECRHNNIIRSDALLLESIDFNFCISSQSFSQEVLSTADELFANGKIRPAEVKKKSAIPKPKKEATLEQNFRSKPISSHLRRDTSVKSQKAEKTEAPQNSITKKKSLKEFLSLNLESDTEVEEEEEGEEKKPSPASATKTFWQFRRSSSLNFDSCRSNTLIRSLHFLSRSNSTGSAPNPKSSSSSKVMRKQNSQKDHQPSSAKRTKSSLSSSSTSSSSSSSSNHYFYSNGSGLYRSPSRKNYHQGNGVRISPVLNIPHACISKGTVSSLFGLGSLFCNGKSKNKKK
ncbi:OLC1v1032247C1 [Oldenlandia corymbosa var. corymbosa]|uniref:OLC1v1032247C1 n=1 Tax=Oldenlandia corymbosa var. corymbosa TaxID=529605 RepID=A0AAV1CNF5_OLDCO|nr:OLC1v1032247C1 [Oldenlandia corymbosa var. corymbosa]